MLEELLIEFNKKYQAPYDYKKDGEETVFYLTIAPDFNLELRPFDKYGIFFRANLFLLLDPDKETLFRRLLETNFLYQATLGFVLGLDPQEKYVTLSHYIYIELTEELFCETVEHFCNAIDYLRHHYAANSKRNHDF